MEGQKSGAKRLRIVVICGIDLTADHNRITDSSERLQKAKQNAVDLFGGYSFNIVQGGWIGGDGKLFEESAVRFEFLAYERDLTRGYKFAEQMKELFEQQSVLISYETLRFDYV